MQVQLQLILVRLQLILVEAALWLQLILAQNFLVCRFGCFGLQVATSSAVVAVGMTRNLKERQSMTQSAQMSLKPNPHAGHSMNNMNPSGMNGSSQDNGHYEGHKMTNEGTPEIGESVRAKLSVNKSINPNQRVTFSINVQDSMRSPLSTVVMGIPCY